MAQDKDKKRRYEKPAVESEKILETAALACGKLQQTSACVGMKKLS